MMTGKRLRVLTACAGLLVASTAAAVSEPDTLLTGKVAVVKPGKTAKLKSKGSGYLPIANDPTADGATLTLLDLQGSGGLVSYALPASGWSGDQTHGFKYHGAGSPADPCKVVLLSATIVKAVCKGTSLTTPLAGDLAAVLEISDGGKKFCLEFPPATNSAKLFKGKNAPAPAACPVTEVEVLPDSAEKLPGGTQQFVVSSGPALPYTWSVNGVDGGDATFGTIDASGFYVAPASVPTPATFLICARVTALPALSDCSSMTINPIPTPGEDVVVFNDLNVLDDSSMTDPNNMLMVHNLLTYSTGAVRGTGTTVLLDGGHGSVCGSGFCGSSFSLLAAQISSEGFTLTTDTSGDLSTIAPDVKVLVLWLPTVFYSTAEINAMKQFAAQGGRIVFIGEHSGYYGSGFPAQNDFLSKMGAQMTNVGNFIDCGYNTLPATSLRAHQVTTGMTDVTMACSSEITLGANDFALYYDSSNTRVLSGVAKIDTVPLPLSFAPRAAAVAPAVAQTHDPIGNPLP